MIFDRLGEAIYTAFEAILSIFPTSPFVILDDMANNAFGEWLAILNWFIPVNTFVGILQVWLAGIAIYYVLQIALRWIRAIE